MVSVLACGNKWIQVGMYNVPPVCHDNIRDLLKVVCYHHNDCEYVSD